MSGFTLSSAVLIAACGNGTDGEEGADPAEVGSVGAMENYQAGDTFVATEPLELEILYRDLPAYPLDKEWMFFEVLEEEHNVSFETISVPLSDWEERLSVTMAAGDLPDYSTDIWAGHETEYVRSGTVLPISDYVEYMPHFQQRLDEWDGVQEQIDNLRFQDGKYYVLPGINENVQFDFSLAYNKTVFDEYGLEEPQSWDELRSALEVLKEETGSTAPMTLWWQGTQHSTLVELPLTQLVDGGLWMVQCTMKRKMNLCTHLWNKAIKI